MKTPLIEIIMGYRTTRQQFSRVNIAEQVARLGADSLLPPDKPSKYRAKKTIVDGITFASGAEAKRWSELRLLERAGHILDLVRQPQFVFTVNDKMMFRYIADFQYFQGDGEVIEDVKGVKTPVYKLKKKLIEAQHGITITEVAA
jgi:Protein of unknown function (DUF1064)